MYQKPDLLLKKRKLVGVPTEVGCLIFFSLNFLHVLYVATPTDLYAEYFFYQFRKNKIFFTFFVGIAE